MWTARHLLTNSPHIDKALSLDLSSLFCFQGGYAGNAAGMKISSLHKLTDIRSNKPGMNLVHYVAQQAEQTQPELLSVVEDLAVLEEASK